MAEQVLMIEEVLREVAGPDIYRLNPFRIAELPVDAGARDISRRQSIIKQANQTGQSVPAGYGRALPLNDALDPDTFSEAIQHLNDPERRIVYEVFWFWPRQFGESRKDEAFAALARGEKDMVYRFWLKQRENPADGAYALHNLAVLSHASALDLEQVALTRALSDQERAERDSWWQQAFRYWASLIEDEAFWSRLTGRIRALDDPRLPTGVARRMSMYLSQTLLFINAQLAVSAAERNDLAGCRQQVALMRASGFDQQVIEESLRHAIEPTRDRIKALCKMIETRLNGDLVDTGDTVERFLGQSESLLAILDSLLPAGNATRDGMHDEVAQHALGALVVYGNKTEKWAIVLPLIDRIYNLAVGPALRTRIEENRKSAKDNMSLIQCWYCGKNESEKACAYELKVYGEVQRVPTIVNGQLGTQLQWRGGSIQVPRCSSCKAQHGRRMPRTSVSQPPNPQKASQAVWGWGCGLNVLLFVIISAATGGNGAGAAVAISIVLLIITSVIAGAARSGARNYIPPTPPPQPVLPSGIRAATDCRAFPLVQQLLSQGWQIGERPYS
jgi:hypothetical protein